MFFGLFSNRSDRAMLAEAARSEVPGDAEIAEARRLIERPFPLKPDFPICDGDAAAAARLRAAACAADGPELLLLAYRLQGKDTRTVSDAIFDEMLMHTFHA